MKRMFFCASKAMTNMILHRPGLFDRIMSFPPTSITDATVLSSMLIDKISVHPLDTFVASSFFFSSSVANRPPPESSTFVTSCLIFSLAVIRPPPEHHHHCHHHRPHSADRNLLKHPAQSHPASAPSSNEVMT
jgi:hypothetical protein